MPIPARRLPIARLAALAALLAATVPNALAQGFSAYASPSRFEVTATPGEARRHVLEIHHVGREPGRFRIYTNDWELHGDNLVKFSDELAPGSCRPWVAVERRELTVPPNGRYRFRFEVSPPAGTPAGECRFAIMIEGMDPTQVTEKGFTFPVAGRLGVIVYVAIAGALPQLSLGETAVRTVKGEQLPMVQVTNRGNAHGRLEGFLNGKDASGREFEMAAEDAPVLPGATRWIALREIGEAGKKLAAIQYPLSVKGAVEWGKTRETLELRFAP
jgi:hypothetical protein